jgi:hypothetical protein
MNDNVPLWDWEDKMPGNGSSNLDPAEFTDDPKMARFLEKIRAAVPKKHFENFLLGSEHYIDSPFNTTLTEYFTYLTEVKKEEVKGVIIDLGFEADDPVELFKNSYVDKFFDLLEQLREGKLDRYSYGQKLVEFLIELDEGLSESEMQIVDLMVDNLLKSINIRNIDIDKLDLSSNDTDDDFGNDLDIEEQ